MRKPKHSTIEVVTPQEEEEEGWELVTGIHEQPVSHTFKGQT